MRGTGRIGGRHPWVVQGTALAGPVVTMPAGPIGALPAGVIGALAAGVIGVLAAGGLNGLRAEDGPAGGDVVPGRAPGARAAADAEPAGPSILDTLLESRPEADVPPLVRIDLQGRRAVATLIGCVQWRYSYRGESVYLQADRLLVEVRLPEDERKAEGPAAEKAKPANDPGKDARREAGKDAGKDGRKDAGQDDILRDGVAGVLRKVRDFRFYADGNVRIEIPGRRTFFEADSFYYEHASGRGVARHVRLRTTYTAARGVTSVFGSTAYRPAGEYREAEDRELLHAPLTIHAEMLRMDGFEAFEGTGIDVSTCEFAVPHYSIRASSVAVMPVREDAAPSAPSGAPSRPGTSGDGAARSAPAPGTPATPGRPDGADRAAPSGGAQARDLPGRDFIIDPESSWVTAFDHRIVPLPISSWDTRWSAQFPVRSVDLGSSSKYGQFAGAEWNVNYILDLVPLERFAPVSILTRQARLGVATDAMTERGFGVGPSATYGERVQRWEPWQLQLDAWSYYGEAGYYRIDDHGDEDRSTGLAPPEADRYWGHVWHRQSIPYLGQLDLEVSKISDRAFLREFFEEVAKDEKEQENLAYLRRNAFDNVALTALYQARGNDFQSQTERVPEGKALLLEQPVFGSGLYTGLKMQAAYLRRLEDDALGIPPETVGRFDALNEWSAPISLSRYLHVRPFALARYSVYGETAVGDDTEDRATVGAGISVSQEWSRIYHLGPGSLLARFLGTRALRHSVTPEVTYLNIFYNGYDPADLIPIDSVDAVDLQESIAFTLRNEVLIREDIPGEPRKVAPTLRNRDGELETAAFRTRTLLDSDASFILYPDADRDNDGNLSSLLRLDNTAFLTRRLYARGWFELDPHETFDLTRVDGSLGYEVVPRNLWVSVGDRYTRGRTNYLYTTLNWNVTEKWGLDAYYAYDFATGDSVQYNFALHRIFHRFALSLEFSLDVGEDDNLSVYVNFMPVEIWRPVRSRIPRTF